MNSSPRSLEDEICDKYEQERRAIHRGYSAGNRHDEHWKKAAILIRSLGADPRLFVEAQFKIGAVSRSGDVPFPSQIYCAQAIENYEKYRDAFAGEAEEMVKGQFRYLANFMNNCGLTMDDAVGDRTNPFRPYFRVLVCSAEKLPEIEAKWGRGARHELELNRDLSRYLIQHYGHRAQRILRQTLPGEGGSPHRPLPGPAFPARERQDLTRRF